MLNLHRLCLTQRDYRIRYAGGGGFGRKSIAGYMRPLVSNAAHGSPVRAENHLLQFLVSFTAEIRGELQTDLVMDCLFECDFSYVDHGLYILGK